ncbi:MAG: hypothetical protein WKF37_01205 [Bryobacteraceae bacterium]
MLTSGASQELISRANAGDADAVARLSGWVWEEIRAALARHLDRPALVDQVRFIHVAVLKEIDELTLVEPPTARVVDSIIRWKIQDYARELRQARLSRPDELRDPDVTAMKEFLHCLSHRERDALRLFYVDRREESEVCRDCQLTPESLRMIRLLLRACFSQTRLAVS